MGQKEIRLTIDSRNGGNGDVWMRLVGFYVIAALKPEIKIRILIPAFLRNLAKHTFSDRLEILNDEQECESPLIYTSLGFKDLFIGIVKGEKYISPYQRSVIIDKKKRQFKDVVNIILFNLSDYAGWIQVPAWSSIKLYQGYLDIIGVKKIREIDYEQFVTQLESDSERLYSKLNSNLPISPELTIPKDLEQNVVIFPTGTSRQFIPVNWAVKNFPDAYFAFFYRDPDAELFQKNGLKIVFFYKEPGDIIFLSQKAKWTISTDSFPSHLLQYSSNKCSITITEVLKSRIISPVFKGKVIDAEVSCHPCLHLDRKNHPKCAAGYEECLNWKNNTYTNNLKASAAKAN
ncbi:hypothetical protein [Cognataquiflexum rubidum]|uniref:hypothetical protein n=1 Tax=Cognataquiflexum rubidum TaxID=2922273 RepID=UPI001F1300DB|nr:hypothetical protein [Cognataquiflexum rubidum]MCH6234035.1 hypothetical protein [Cognataquiflexum rubidum]